MGIDIWPQACGRVSIALASPGGGRYRAAFFGFDKRSRPAAAGRDTRTALVGAHRPPGYRGRFGCTVRRCCMAAALRRGRPAAANGDAPSARIAIVPVLLPDEDSLSVVRYDDELRALDARRRCKFAPCQRRGHPIGRLLPASNSVEPGQRLLAAALFHPVPGAGADLDCRRILEPHADPMGGG